jgi:hypothetical protein
MDNIKLGLQALVKLVSVVIITIIILSFISKCGNHRPQLQPKEVVIYKDKEVKVPVYIPGKKEVQVVYKTNTKYIYDTAKVYVTKYIKDSTLNTRVNCTEYDRAIVKDTITYAGYLVSHKQSLYQLPRIDSTVIKTIEKIIVDTVTVNPPNKSQLYIGVNTGVGVNNQIFISPQLGLRLKNGFFFTVAKSVTCKTCGNISINAPLKIKQN